MENGRGLSFIFTESGVLLRKAWWLVLLIGTPFCVTEMVRWSDEGPDIWPYFAVGVLTGALYLYLFLVLVRVCGGGLSLRTAMRIDAPTMRAFAPYAAVTITFVAAQEYVLLRDQTMPTYWLLIAAAIIYSALTAPWAVASALGAADHGPARSLRAAAPHFLWSSVIYGGLAALEFGGYVVIGLTVLPVSDLELAGMPVFYIGYGLQMLVLVSWFSVLNQVATIAIARRAGLGIPAEDRAIVETFS